MEKISGKRNKVLTYVDRMCSIKGKRRYEAKEIFFWKAVAQHAFGNGFTFVRDYRAGKSR